MFKVFSLLIFSLVNVQNLLADNETCTSIGANSSLIIATTLNGQIKGECKRVLVGYSNNSEISYDVFSWKSIPFGEPPIQQNRFKRPIPVANWQGIKDGTQFPRSCKQQTDPLSAEDCLYLNVFVRSDVYLNRNTTLKPILVFIHGGDFTAGGSAGYDGSVIVSMREIIVITIQYRLDVFGFIRLEDSDATGNQGLFDQNLALQWIYNNANNFGGDQNRITINGESAGADSVNLLL